MKLDLYKDVPSWAHVSAMAMLIIVTILLFIGQVITQDYWQPQLAIGPSVEQITAQLADKQETLDLAIEFGFDPLIVQVARQQAKIAFREHQCNCQTWRFVRSDRDLTYLLLSIVSIESRGNYHAFNPAGPAYGLTQLLLSTAREYDKNITETGLYTIPQHLKIATEHFVGLLERFNGNYTLAVIAWNRGAGGVDRSIALGQSPDNNYAKAVLTQASLRNAQ